MCLVQHVADSLNTKVQPTPITQGWGFFSLKPGEDTMQYFLVISVISQDKPGLAEHFSGMATECGCNVEDSRMAVMGNEFATIMMVSGDESQIQQAEQAFSNLQNQPEFQVCLRRTEAAKGNTSCRPYSIQALSLDGPGIIRQVSDFLAQRKINIEDMQSNSYKAPHTGAPMLEMQIVANIPADISMSELRDAFADLCDDLQIDAIIEPIKY
jgi:glycine cleavage system transcriptional repressor